MKISEHDNDLIQKYLTDTLTSADEALFKQKLTHESFREELEVQAELVDTLSLAEEDLIREELLSFETGATPSKDVKAPNSKKPIYMLLGGIILLGLLAGAKQLLQTTPASDPIQMAEVYATPYPPRDVYRSVVENKESDVQVKEAMKAYSKKQYAEALVQFEKVTTQTDEILMYRVNCHIAGKQYTEAKSLLDKLMQSPYEDLSQNSEWYLAICELGLKNVSVAKQKLTTIQSNSDHPFSDRAAKLLAELD